MSPILFSPQHGGSVFELNNENSSISRVCWRLHGEEPTMVNGDYGHLWVISVST